MVASRHAALETRSNSVWAPLCFLLTLEALDSKETRLFHLCLHSGSSKPMISYSPNVSSKCLFVLSLSFQGLGQGWGGRAWRRGKGSTLLGEEEQCQLSLQQPGGAIRTQGMFVIISKSGLNCFGLNWSRALRVWRKASDDPIFGVGSLVSSFFFDIGAQSFERIKTLRI